MTLRQTQDEKIENCPDSYQIAIGKKMKNGPESCQIIKFSGQKNELMK